MKLLFKILLAAAVLAGGYYFYVARYSHPEGLEFLQKILASHQQGNTEEDSNESSNLPSSQPSMPTTDDNHYSTTTSTTHYKIQKCTTSDGRVIYVDHSTEGQCKNLETENKTLTLAHTEKSLTTDNSSNPSNVPKFTCDGRTRCNQMKSCDEAKFFLAHCPNVEMDGDKDGIPCEAELCGH